jgi:hypothetical protein
MKKLFNYLCVFLILVTVATSCSSVSNPGTSKYQKKNTNNFAKKKGRAETNGAKYHPAVKRKNSTVW